jgi:serine/threonine-protein kinase
MSILAGSRLGPYEILSPLGAGGMGQVWRARDTRLDRFVAIKILPDELVEDADALARFEREAKAVAALSHPNILAIHDFARQGSVVYAVMELLEGETLGDRLAADTLSARRAVEYALQIAHGLAAAHERGIVHRDLKPQNVFVTRDGQIKLLDFGLAKSTRSSMGGQTGALTQPGLVLGTVGYMSPEQVRGEGVDYRSDIFAFGIILYEMLAGQRAFQRDSDVETMIAILKEDPAELMPAGHAVPRELTELVAHCLEKSPEQRFQSARDLAFALKVQEREGWPISGSTAPGSGARHAAAREASIAVLPFRNLSAGPENDYFSDGMTEEIINALTKIEALHVASRTSSFAFKGKDEDVRKIGSALGVGTVLEGSVRQSGRKLRITAQLIDVASGYHLWSERYDREMEDVFAVQDEIARSIADTLKVRLLPAEEERLAARGTADIEAYNHYLKGRYHFNRREPREAIAEFERALAIDPRYTDAYTGLADSYCIHGFYGGIPTVDALARARKAARKAHDLEPDSADVHVSLALVEHYFGWDLDREEVELRRAMEISPRSAAAYSWLGLMLPFRRRFSEGLELARKAAELEPHSANIQTNVGWALCVARRFEDAVREFERALAIDPNAPYPLWSIAIPLQSLGRYGEAVATLEKAVELTLRRQTFYLALLGAANAYAGRRSQALRQLEDLRARPAADYVAPFHFAFIHIALGDAREAIACLERGCAERNALGWWLRECPVYDPIRADPGFASLSNRIVPA